MGILNPEETPVALLSAGQVGYVGEHFFCSTSSPTRRDEPVQLWSRAHTFLGPSLLVCNMKSASEATVGDTFHRQGENVDPLPGFRQTKPMVYAGIFPIDSGEFLRLEESVNRVRLRFFAPLRCAFRLPLLCITAPSERSFRHAPEGDFECSGTGNEAWILGNAAS